MAMIKCTECGKDISDKAVVCIGCGAPISISTGIPSEPSAQPSSIVGDLNGDEKVDFEDFKIALSRSKKYASDKVDEAINFGKQKLQSAKEKDAAAVEELAKTFENKESANKTESQINREKFQSALISTIDVRFAEIMASKKDLEAYLTYTDSQILTTKVRAIFKNILTVTPPQVEAACLLSEAVLAPSTKDKENKVKAAVGIAGGTAGIGIVIGAVGSALGWGATIVASLSAAIMGASIVGPIVWGAAGLSIAAIAGYFASTSNHQTDTERFLRVLKSSTGRAVDAIWSKYETELSSAVTQVTAETGSSN